MSIRNTSINKIVIGGYLLILTLIPAIIIVVFSNLGNIKKDINQMTDITNPLIIASNELSQTINLSTSNLGFYLLSKEQKYRELYLNGLDSLTAQSQVISNLLSKAPDEKSSQLLKQINNDIEQLTSQKNKILKFSTNPSLNMPARRYAAENLNPLSNAVLQNLEQIISSEQEEDISAERKKMLSIVYNIRYGWIRFINEIRTFLAVRDNSVIENAKLFQESIVENENELQKHTDLFTFEQEEGVANITTLRIKIFKNFSKMISLQQSPQWKMDSYTIQQDIGPLTFQINEKLNQLNKIQKEKNHQATLALESRTQQVKITLITTLIISLIIGLIIMQIVSKQLSFLINTLKTHFESLSSGNLMCHMDEQHRGEIGEIALSMNAFIDHLRQMIERLQNVTTRLSVDATEMASISDHTHTGVAQQHRETEQVATAITEMTANAKTVADNASDAVNAASNAASEATNGKEVVNQTKSSISTLASDVSEASNVISQLEEDTNSIGTVLDVIRGIADQTNLLALNAAIEAARAGEQGRGFAVVAEEVRTLANRTQNSTQEIQQMIESLQSATQKVVAVMSSGQQQAQISVNESENASDALQTIIESIVTINNMNTQIAVAAKEQGMVSEDINKNILRITDVIDDAVTDAQKLSTTSHEISTLSQQLEEIINYFKLS